MTQESDDLLLPLVTFHLRAVIYLTSFSSQNLLLCDKSFVYCNCKGALSSLSILEQSLLISVIICGDLVVFLFFVYGEFSDHVGKLDFYFPTGWSAIRASRV